MKLFRFFLWLNLFYSGKVPITLLKLDGLNKMSSILQLKHSVRS